MLIAEDILFGMVSIDPRMRTGGTVITTLAVQDIIYSTSDGKVKSHTRQCKPPKVTDTADGMIDRK